MWLSLPTDHKANFDLHLLSFYHCRCCGVLHEDRMMVYEAGIARRFNLLSCQVSVQYRSVFSSVEEEVQHALTPTLPSLIERGASQRKLPPIHENILKCAASRPNPLVAFLEWAGRECCAGCRFAAEQVTPFQSICPLRPEFEHIDAKRRTVISSVFSPKR